ncbi:hypothetical protein K491DRAFT_686532 [Lophiostoma macrostomum CBS 122681]|uniref:Ribosomal protein S21 n=1 Tax=Lophiostoma macrostomum CBS 122681 TaxID=1314788 RepID=A0A6A6TUK4_9PLEO|nr:hypothetical protein K491DRAFT_686532 [Lophiostoma macrostomum CBS 122681]
MGARPLSELVLRSSTSYVSTPIWHQSSASCLSRRALSTITPTRAARPQQKDDPFQQESPAPRDDIPRGAPRSQQRYTDEAPIFYRSGKSRASNAELSQSIDSLFGKPVATRKPAASQTTSADEMAAGHQIFGRLAQRGMLPRKPTLNWDDADMPMDVGIDSAPASQSLHIPDEEIKYPRLNATTGRTVNLDPDKGRDILRGISMLGSLMGRNRVKLEFNKQRFHERPGLKRKRLISERWRKKFKVEFTSVCSRVQELTRKGW